MNEEGFYRETISGKDKTPKSVKTQGFRKD